MKKMAKVEAKAKTRKATIRARVYRASTGQWEDLGVISRSHPDLLERIKKLLRR